MFGLVGDISPQGGQPTFVPITGNKVYTVGSEHTLVGVVTFKIIIKMFCLNSLKYFISLCIIIFNKKYAYVFTFLEIIYIYTTEVDL